ncbi:MAG: proton-conducting transporter membrane subunit [Candidatus Methylomirabilota bacterium]
MNRETLLWLLLALPTLLAGGCLLLPSPRRILLLVSAGGALWGLLAAGAALAVFASGPIFAARGWLFLDPLSGYHLAILGFVLGSSSLYAWSYFRREVAAGELPLPAARRFGALWFGAAAAMTATLLCNNLGLMWVGIEATTLLTAFLISVHITPLSLEAMWKYLLVCSVGVAFAFLGTLLTAASAQQLGLDASEMLLWTRLQASATRLSSGSMRLAFLFLLVGYGTKAGLAPLHSWLPDAHSQAPAPVSALFSGFMLNAAFYCILRHLVLVEGATGGVGWGRELLVLFGLASILLAAAFIIFQRDGKRLLAYSSVEHMGIIALGIGLGGAGTFAALWHALNHSIGKTLSFFAMGRLGQAYGTHDLGRMAGAFRRRPVWAAGFCGGLLALIGVAPLAIFMSELQVLRAAAQTRAYLALILFLLGASIVFVGALRHPIALLWGEGGDEPEPERATPLEWLLAGGALLALLLLGVWLPPPLVAALTAAAQAVEGLP